MAKQNMYCPRHYTTGSSLGDCQIGIVPCPDPEVIDPAKVVEVSCGLCDKKLAVPVADIMKKKLSGLGNCVSDQCAATIVLPDVPPAAHGKPKKAPPPPVQE